MVHLPNRVILRTRQEVLHGFHDIFPMVQIVRARPIRIKCSTESLIDSIRLPPAGMDAEGPSRWHHERELPFCLAVATIKDTPGLAITSTSEAIAQNFVVCREF